MKRMLFVLVGVTVLSGLILAATYSGLRPRIEENRARALNLSLSSLFDTSTEVVFERLPGEDIVTYEGKSPGGALLGYAVQVQAQGYGGTMTLLVGLSSDRSTLTGVEVVEQLETPGLGGRISNQTFRDQFVGLDVRTAITYVKNVQPSLDRNEVQAISGATITSKAVVGAINRDVRAAAEYLEGVFE